MTDKEMAVNWIKENVDSFRSSNMNAYEFAEQAFLAALKIGRPKWHKVADGDLPSVCSIVLDECCNKVWYVGNGKWLIYSEFYEKTIGTNPPIAWCEEPEYTED